MADSVVCVSCKFVAAVLYVLIRGYPVTCAFIYAPVRDVLICVFMAKLLVYSRQRSYVLRLSRNPASAPAGVFFAVFDLFARSRSSSSSAAGGPRGKRPRAPIAPVILT